MRDAGIEVEMFADIRPNPVGANVDAGVQASFTQEAMTALSLSAAARRSMWVN